MRIKKVFFTAKLFLVSKSKQRRAVQQSNKGYLVQKPLPPSQAINRRSNNIYNKQTTWAISTSIAVLYALNFLSYQDKWCSIGRRLESERVECFDQDAPYES